MNSTKRFSSRVENYVKYRPSYPRGVIDLLQRECRLVPGSGVADLGSGTGILSALLLDAGWRVFGVEPNREMREAGQRLLSGRADFVSIDGTAEATTLADGRIDLVTAGQAFHWFDVEATRHECMRILKPNGWVALIWNSRKLDASLFSQAYEQLLRDYSDDYAKVNHQDNVSNAAIGTFFGASHWHKATFDNAQHFDFDGLRGRLLSSSYAPEVGHANHEPMLHKLHETFEAHQHNDRVTFAYDTEVFYGRLV